MRIDSFTGTGIDGGKYDYEAIDRGAFGNIRVTMTLRKYHIDSDDNDSSYTLKTMYQIQYVKNKKNDCLRQKPVDYFGKLLDCLFYHHKLAITFRSDNSI